MSKKLVWLAGALLVFAFVFPSGVDVGKLIPTPPTPAPVPAPAPVPQVPTDADIMKILTNADPADRARIDGIYTALATVLVRDNGKLITSTEKWRTLQSNTLTNAVEQVGKYPGLDAAIENVFAAALGTKDVLPNNGDTQVKLVQACQTIAASAVQAPTTVQ
jgi:hypothetical protein